MTSDTVVSWTRLVADLFDRKGWRDPGNVALGLARALASGASPEAAVKGVPSRFYVQNRVPREVLLNAIRDLVGTTGDPSAPEPTTKTTGPHSSPTSVGWAGGRRRWLLAALATLGTGYVAFGLPRPLWWDWLMDHPNSLGIRALAVLCVALLAGAYASRWRRTILAGACLAAFVALLQLLGR